MHDLYNSYKSDAGTLTQRMLVKCIHDVFPNVTVVNGPSKDGKRIKVLSGLAYCHASTTDHAAYAVTVKISTVQDQEKQVDKNNCENCPESDDDSCSSPMQTICYDDPNDPDYVVSSHSSDDDMEPHPSSNSNIDNVASLLPSHLQHEKFINLLNEQFHCTKKGHKWSTR